MDLENLVENQVELMDENEVKPSSCSCKSYVAAFLIKTFVALLFVWIFYINSGVDFVDKHVYAHILFCSLGTIGLLGLGSLSFRALTWWKRDISKAIHGVLMFIGIILICVGIYAIVKVKNLSGKSHFKSIHSWLGIITFASIGLQFIVAFFVFGLKVTNLKIRQIIKDFHVVIGKFILFFATVTVITGLFYMQLNEFDEIFMERNKLYLNFFSLVTMLAFISISFSLS